MSKGRTKDKPLRTDIDMSEIFVSKYTTKVSGQLYRLVSMQLAMFAAAVELFLEGSSEGPVQGALELQESSPGGHKMHEYHTSS